MQTVTIYKVHCYQAYMADETGSSFNLVPWKGDTIDYKGETVSKADYILPDGFRRIPDNDSISDADYEASEALRAKFVDANGNYWGVTGRDRPVLVQVGTEHDHFVGLTPMEGGVR